MMSVLSRKLAATAVALSLVAVPTGAVASDKVAATPAPSAQQAAIPAGSSPWVALSAMTTSTGAANAVAMQGNRGPEFPPIAPLGVILGTIALAIWILLHDDGDDDIIEPVSP